MIVLTPNKTPNNKKMEKKKKGGAAFLNTDNFERKSGRPTIEISSAPSDKTYSASRPVGMGEIYLQQ
jgi:hypothetical protein